MLDRFKRPRSPIDIEMDALFVRLSVVRMNPDDYKKVMDELDRLHKMKMQNASRRISPDTALMATVNLLGIAMILKHEQFNVITSKALPFLPKPKL